MEDRNETICQCEGCSRSPLIFRHDRVRWSYKLMTMILKPQSNAVSLVNVCHQNPHTINWLNLLHLDANLRIFQPNEGCVTTCRLYGFTVLEWERFLGVVPSVGSWTLIRVQSNSIGVVFFQWLRIWMNSHWLRILAIFRSLLFTALQFPPSIPLFP